MDKSGGSDERNDITNEILNMSCSNNIEPYFSNSSSGSFPSALFNHVVESIAKPILINQSIKAQKEIAIKQLDAAEKMKIAELQHQNLMAVMSTVQFLAETGNLNQEALTFIRDFYDDSMM